MTEYDCDTLLCSKVDFLHDAIRGDSSEVLVNGKSFLAQISDGIKRPAKKWISTQEYKIGDIVSVGAQIYISKTNNLNQNPTSKRSHWQVYQLPYTQNQGKVKAFLVMKTDLTIIDSYNIASVSELSDSRFQVNFLTAIDSYVIPTFGLPESALDERLSVSCYEIGSAYLKYQIMATTAFTSLYGVNDNDDRYITMICYGTGNTLHS